MNMIYVYVNKKNKQTQNTHDDAYTCESRKA